MPVPNDSKIHDVVVVGAGISGILFLRHARERGLRCRVLEKQDDVGGLWRWLPKWQDIQNRKQDFAIEDVPLDGVRQPAILRHIREWVRRHELAPFISLGQEVESVEPTDGAWIVRSDRGDVRTRHLVVASGSQNRPWIPPIERHRPEVEETHSSALHRPERLEDRRVTVVGGGASGWDLLDLALAQGAREIRWVYRNTRWFLPTTRGKQKAWPNLRELALMQSVMPPRAVTSSLRWLLRRRFARLKLNDIEPAEPFDLRRHQLNPGRARMIRRLGSLRRHRARIRAIRGREVELDDGERFATDIVLWGTGYRMDLSYLGLPELAGAETLDQLLPRLGSLTRSLDYPNLFFVGLSLSENTSSTPFFAAIEAKSIVAHILGECEIPLRHTPDRVAYWDVYKHFARFDRSTYRRPQWWFRQLGRAWWYALLRQRSVRI